MKPLSYETEWTQTHFRWLEMLKFAQPAQQIVLQAYVDKVIACGKVARAVGAGNGRVRRALVEAAWTYRHTARKTEAVR